jgi:hypothetical protein
MSSRAFIQLHAKSNGTKQTLKPASNMKDEDKKLE